MTWAQGSNCFLLFKNIPQNKGIFEYFHYVLRNQFFIGQANFKSSVTGW